MFVFVLRDFEVGRNVSCEESTVSPVWANLLSTHADRQGVDILFMFVC